MNERSDDRPIHVVALGVVRRDDEVLVAREDASERRVRYRPVGDAVRFGEDSVDALRRAFRERLEVELDGVVELGAVEVVSGVDDERRHEVALVYEAAVTQRWLYRLDSFPGYDPATETEFDCVWKPVSAFVDGDDVLSPRGLAGRL